MATVYMRYHYVIDVIGGITCFILTIWSGLRIDAWWRRKKVIA
jgi:membrane-associated phospholipid phosphatase